MNGIIILLGAPNDEYGNLSEIAKSRCQHAMLEYHQHPRYKILPTGGYGAHFNVTDKPHAYYAQCYLIAHGVPETDILEFVESTNTIEDAELSWPIVQKHGVSRIIVITSDFHIPRVKFVFSRTFFDVELTFSGCRTSLLSEQLHKLQQHEAQALTRLQNTH